MLQYGNNNEFNENNQEQNSSSQDGDAITPIRGRYTNNKSQKKFLIRKNDSIPTLNNQQIIHNNKNHNSSSVADNEEDLNFDIIRRNNNRIDCNNYKREAIKFDAKYLETNLLLQEFLFNKKKSSINNNKSYTTNDRDDRDHLDDDLNDHDDDESQSCTILSSECIYQNFCNECGYDILLSASKGNLCDLCQYNTDEIKKINNNNNNNHIADIICMKCGILFYGRDGAELCRNCQTIRNEQLLFEQNDLEKIYINEYLNNNNHHQESKNNNIFHKKLIKNNKNQKRFFHGILDTLKRVKNNKKIIKQYSATTTTTSADQQNRLQIIHNIDGFDNVFHTKDTFDIKKISELKANSSQTTTAKNLLETEENDISLNCKINKFNKNSTKLLKCRRYESKSDSNLNRLRKNDSSIITISDSSKSKTYNHTEKPIQTQIEDNSIIDSIQQTNVSDYNDENENFSTSMKLQIKFSHSKQKTNNNSQKEIVEKVTSANNTNNNNYKNIHYRNSGALKKQIKYDKRINDFKPDFSSMKNFSGASMKLSMINNDDAKITKSNDYCYVFDSVIDWLNTIRNEQHIYYNFDYDDSINCVKNIPSRTNYYDYDFGYNYLTASTNSATTITTAKSLSNYSYNSCNNYNNNRFNFNNSNNISKNLENNDDLIYIEMQRKNENDHKFSKINTIKTTAEDHYILKNDNTTISSGNSIFYTTNTNTTTTTTDNSSETFNLLHHGKDIINAEQHFSTNLQVNSNIRENNNLPTTTVSSQAHSYSYSNSSCCSVEKLLPTTKSLCLPYEFSSNKHNTTTSRRENTETESVHLYSSAEQQVISSITGGTTSNNNDIKNKQQTVNNINSDQEIIRKKKKKSQNKYQKLKCQTENNIKHQQINEFEKEVIEIEGNSRNIIQQVIPKNLTIYYCSSSTTCSSSDRDRDRDCGGSSNSNCISDLNDEYTRHMVDKFKRNLMEKQNKYNEFIRQQQQRSKRRAIYLKPDDETVDQLQLNHYRGDNIENIAENHILLKKEQEQQSITETYYNRNISDNSFDLENNSNDLNKFNNNNSNIIENDINELENATITASNALSICEISNTKNNSNISNNSNDIIVINDIIANSFDLDIVKYRDFKTNENIRLLCNTNENNKVKSSSDTNNYNSDITSYIKANKKSPEIDFLYSNIISVKNHCINYNNNNLPLNITTKLFPSQQLLQLENIIIALNLSKCLNKIIIFYDKNLSIFLNYIQNTQKYSRCEQKYLLKFFKKFHRFVITNQIFEKENIKNQLVCNNKTHDIIKKEIPKEENIILIENNNIRNVRSNTKQIEFNNNTSILNVNIDINKDFVNDPKNSNINNIIIRKKPVPPPRRFLPHMAPTLPPTPPLKPRNLYKAIELEHSTTTVVTQSSQSANSTANISPPIVVRRKINPRNKVQSSSSSLVCNNIRSQLKDDDEIYQPIWKCQTINNSAENNNTNNSKSEFGLKSIDDNNKAPLNTNYNESEINNKELSTFATKRLTSPPTATKRTTIGLKTRIPINFIEDIIDNNDIKDDSSRTGDTAITDLKFTINNTTVEEEEEDHSQWETDDEFMFSTKMSSSKNNKSTPINTNNNHQNNQRISKNINDFNNKLTNKENEDDYYNAYNSSSSSNSSSSGVGGGGGGSSTSTGSTLTGNNYNNNCMRISKSDPELKKESVLFNHSNSCIVIEDQKTMMTNNINSNINYNNNNNSNKNNDSSWKTVCIIYSPNVTKYRRILYDYNINEINYNLNEKLNLNLKNINTNKNNNNSELNIMTTSNIINSIKNNTSSQPQLNTIAATTITTTTTTTNPNASSIENENSSLSSVTLRSNSFRGNRNENVNRNRNRNENVREDIAYKRKITAIAALDGDANIYNIINNNSNNLNCNTSYSSYNNNNSYYSSGGESSATNESKMKSDFFYNNTNFNSNYNSIIIAWKENLMDINYIEDEEDMFVSEEEILKLKETAVQPEPNRLQRYKSQSTDNLHSIPDVQDKKSIGERFRNKLQRGVLKLNSRQVKDNGAKKGKETFKRLNVNSVCFEEGIQPKYPIFNAELHDVEMNPIDENVPRFVVDCIEIIEQKDCIQIDGLYRASGNKVAIDDLKKKLTETYIFDNKLLMKNEDIHTITGLLKLFFRELKTPLIADTFYCKLPENLVDNSSLPLIKLILNDIQQPSLGTLKYLLKHLTTVAQYCSENRMPASNLAIVWGPCILLSDNTGPFDIGRMNTLAKILIEKYDYIFGDDERLVN